MAQTCVFLSISQMITLEKPSSVTGMRLDKACILVGLQPYSPFVEARACFVLAKAKTPVRKCEYLLLCTGVVAYSPY